MLTGINNTQLEENFCITLSSAKTAAPASVFLSCNGRIENTRQSDYTGDCWLLSNVNTLRDTSWGQQMLKDAIKPDGKGGAIITFKGSKGKQKAFKISAQDIAKAKKSGRYSSGDDDMIAMELAMERYLKLYGKLHQRTNTAKAAAGANLEGSTGFDQHEFIKLLSGKDVKNHTLLMYDNPTKEEKAEAKNDLNRILNEIEKNPGKYAITVDFKSDWGNMYTNHAYQVKEVITNKKGQKFVVLVNPWDSSQKVKIPYNSFAANLRALKIAEQPGAKTNKNLVTNYERLQERVEYGELLKKIFASGGEDKSLFKELASKTNTNTIKYTFTSKDSIETFIKLFDKVEYGWGHGKDKKALIKPFVDAYCEYAKQNGVDDKIINKAKKACYDELDAMLYTNENTIIENLQKLFDKIEEKKNPAQHAVKKFGL